jgi:hypothetical protein
MVGMLLMPHDVFLETERNRLPPRVMRKNGDRSALLVSVMSTLNAVPERLALLKVCEIRKGRAVVSEIVPRANPVMAVLFAIATPKSESPVMVPEVMAATELAPPVVPTKTFDSALRRFRLMSR